MTVLVTGAVTLTATWLAQHAATRRDAVEAERRRSLAVEERNHEMSVESHAFQRQTLLELQDALHRLVRAKGKLMHFDHLQAREGRFVQGPQGMDLDLLAAGVEVRKLQARVLSDEVRLACEKLFGVTNREPLGFFRPDVSEQITGEELEREASSRILDLSEAYAEANEVLGEALRRELAPKLQVRGAGTPK